MPKSETKTVSKPEMKTQNKAEPSAPSEAKSMGKGEPKTMAKTRAQAAADRAHTVRLHRVFAAKPEKVYRAFLDPDALARWLPPNGFTCKVHQFDARPGGHFRMSFTNFSTDRSTGFGGEFLELEPSTLIRYTDKFEDPNLPGEILVTVRLRAVSVGTEVEIVQENLPAVIPLEACYLGWQQSLAYLALLVEPEISD